MTTRLAGPAGLGEVDMLPRVRGRHPAAQQNPVSLRNGQVLRLGKLRRAMLQAVRGTVWVTQDGDIRDVILESGDTIWLDRGADVLVSAMSDASITLRRSA